MRIHQLKHRYNQAAFKNLLLSHDSAYCQIRKLLFTLNRFWEYNLYLCSQIISATQNPFYIILLVFKRRNKNCFFSGFWCLVLIYMPHSRVTLTNKPVFQWLTVCVNLTKRTLENRQLPKKNRTRCTCRGWGCSGLQISRWPIITHFNYI